MVNTGDDTVLHGLHVSPDVDTVIYTLADAVDPERGWGLAGETWKVMEALERLGGITWFALGDRDLATHCYRTQRLSEGAALGTVTAELARAFGVGIRRAAGDRRSPLDPSHPARRRGDRVPGVLRPPPSRRRGRRRRVRGRRRPRPAPGVLEAIDEAETVVVCPSNPVVSIGPLLAVPGVADRLLARRERVVGVSPIVAGVALKGPAGRLLVEMGYESTVVGVARFYANWVGTLVIDEADADLGAAVQAEGVRCVVAPTVMSTPERSAALARAVLDAAG